MIPHIPVNSEVLVFWIKCYTLLLHIMPNLCEGAYDPPPIFVVCSGMSWIYFMCLISGKFMNKSLKIRTRLVSRRPLKVFNVFKGCFVKIHQLIGPRKGMDNTNADDVRYVEQFIITELTKTIRNMACTFSNICH